MSRYIDKLVVRDGAAIYVSELNKKAKVPKLDEDGLPPEGRALTEAEMESAFAIVSPEKIGRPR